MKIEDRMLPPTPSKVTEILPGRTFKALNCRDSPFCLKLDLKPEQMEYVPAEWKNRMAATLPSGSIVIFGDEVQCVEVQTSLTIQQWTR